MLQLAQENVLKDKTVSLQRMVNQMFTRLFKKDKAT